MGTSQELEFVPNNKSGEQCGDARGGKVGSRLQARPRPLSATRPHKLAAVAAS